MGKNKQKQIVCQISARHSVGRGAGQSITSRLGVTGVGGGGGTPITETRRENLRKQEGKVTAEGLICR